jgi:copper transport protein
VRRCLLLVAVAAGALFLSAPAAWAHAGLSSSDPAAGATVPTAPPQVTMTFTETPDPSLSVVHVLDTSGTSVESGPVIASGPDELSVPLPPDLPDGTYTVSWRVVSAQDGHVTAGTFSFGVGQAPTTPSTGTATSTTATPGPSPLSVIGKFLLYAGLVLVVGAVSTGLWAFGGHVPARRRLLPLAGVATFLGAVLLVVAERSSVGVSFAALFRSSTGKPLIWLAVGAAATALGALYAGRDDSRSALATAGIAAAITMYTRAEGGHGGAGGWIQVSLQWLHFLAIGVWIGGFVPVVLLLRERRRAGEPPPVAEVGRYSRMAGYALIVVVASGVLRAVNELGGWGALVHAFDTSYGIVLAVKVGLAVLLIALGAANRYRSIPRLSESTTPIRRILSVEVIGAVSVLALTGVLTGLSPNQPASAASSRPTDVTASGHDFATTLKVTLTATPGTPGTNAFAVQVLDYDTGAPLDVSSVTLRFTPVGRPDVASSDLSLTRRSERWVGQGGNLSLAGSWNVIATVQQGAKATEVEMSLSTLAPDQQVASTAPVPGQPTLYTMTLPGGQALQAYNDPGTTGTNQLHVTAFDAQGQELPLASLSLVATPQGGRPEPLDATRLEPGHFVASVDLTDGPWHFDITATTRAGTVLVASFDQTIG